MKSGTNWNPPRRSRLRLEAHGQLVAEVRGGGQAHPGDVHVLAEVGDGLHIELVEGDQTFEFAAAAKICNGVGYLLEVQAFRHVDHFGEDVVWPVGVAMLFKCQQQDPTAHGGTLPHERLSLFIGREA